MKTILELEKVEKYYGSRSSLTKAIDNISFKVDEGEFVAIMGSSGSGKTTLLNTISTIDRVTSGHIYVDGDDITNLRGDELNRFRREELGFIFQDFNLLDTLNLRDNIYLPLVLAGEDYHKMEDRIQPLAEKLEIQEILEKYPYQVSGGQKQRAACARALINNPKLILADEPTGALDSNSSAMLLHTLQTMNQKLGATILMVTHDVFSACYCEKILFLSDGKIYAELKRGNAGKRDYLNRILDMQSEIGGQTIYDE